ncbi:MAG: amidohydrolase family protein [Hyphomonadaceae bacterium]
MTHGKTAALAALLIAAACAPQEQTAAAAGDAVLFHDVRVLDFSGDAPEAREHMSVLVRGGTVETVAAVNDLKAPAGAQVIEGAGRTLLPGLVDMHVHIWDQAELGAYLSYGVTTVRNASGMPFLLEMRDAIDAGELTGPRIVTTGPILNSTGPNAQLNHQIVDTADAARAAVQAQYDAGYRRLKVYSNLTREAYDAIHAEAQRLGMTVMGHTPEGVRDPGIPFQKPFRIAFEELLDDGFVTIEHMESVVWHGLYDDFDEDKARDLARKVAASGTAVDPTLLAHRNLTLDAATKGEYASRPGVDTLNPFVFSLEGAQRDRWAGEDAERAQRADDFYARATKIFHEEGVTLVTGTDAGIFINIPGASLIDELELMHGAGLTPVEVLRAATVNAATVLDEAGRFGRIASGQRADMVLTDGDPLTDLDVLRNPAGVMHAGAWLDADALAALRAGAANTDFERSETNIMAAMAAQQ